jgi:hypothetical protein
MVRLRTTPPSRLRVVEAGEPVEGPLEVGGPDAVPVVC